MLPERLFWIVEVVRFRSCLRENILLFRSNPLFICERCVNVLAADTLNLLITITSLAKQATAIIKMPPKSSYDDNLMITESNGCSSGFSLPLSPTTTSVNDDNNTNGVAPIIRRSGSLLFTNIVGTKLDGNLGFFRRREGYNTTSSTTTTSSSTRSTSRYNNNSGIVVHNNHHDIESNHCVDDDGSNVEQQDMEYISLFPHCSSNSKINHDKYTMMNDDASNDDDDSKNDNDGNSNENENRDSNKHYPSSSSTLTSSYVFKLVFGASGIYTAYLYYGHIQEDLFLYKSSINGTMFHYAWLLQTLESFSIVFVGAIMLLIQNYWSRTSDIRALPKRPFFQSGASQVLSKTFTSLSLSAGLSFPVCTLAKSAKLVPVMIGQLVFGGTTKYTAHEYAFAALLVSGTALLSLNTGGSSHGSNSTSSMAGILWISASLIMDGVTAGLQKRIQIETIHAPPKTLDFLLLTNISMGTIALIVSILLPSTITTIASSSSTPTTYDVVSSNELLAGMQYLQQNPVCLRMVLTLCICSIIGQTFIFYIIAQFDPLVCSSITTTRKILSVLWSIVMKGHVISFQGKIGILLAITGMMLEIKGKSSSSNTGKQQHPSPNNPISNNSKIISSYPNGKGDNVISNSNKVIGTSSLVTINRRKK